MHKSNAFIFFIAVALFALSVPAFGQEENADSYYLYTNWNPHINYTTGINGYIDVNGDIEGIPGGEYIFVVGGPSYNGNHTGYVYRVETAGNPDMHPSNPDATGPIAPRTFTLVNSHFLGSYSDGHRNAFYVDSSGIYYGADVGWSAVHGCGIYHWALDWTPIGCEVPLAAPSGAQTLARNPNNGDWWITTSTRGVYRWDGAAWVYQFTHPNLAGGHSDGMEIIGSSLFISDMTSDVLIQYRLDENGDVIDPPNSPYETYTYSAGPAVEGMGYGPNAHIWISGWSSYTIYEIGGGCLQPWIEEIPDQAIYPGETFDLFDLDDYVGCVEAPYTWEYGNNVDLSVEIDADNVATVTYPEGWTGAEEIIFILTDSQGRTVNRSATFSVIGAVDAAAIIQPDTLRFYWAYAIDPMSGTILLGNITDHTAGDVDPSTLMINSSISPNSTAIVASHPAFTGDVLAVEVPLFDFITGYGQLWDTVTYDFDIVGGCTDGAMFAVTGQVVILGIMAGDANGDGKLNVDDPVVLMNYIFKSGPPPKLIEAGDADSDGLTNIADAVYLIRYLFDDGPRPSHP